jgi:hypothetical protein
MLSLHPNLDKPEYLIQKQSRPQTEFGNETAGKPYFHFLPPVCVLVAEKNIPIKNIEDFTIKRSTKFTCQVLKDYFVFSR